MAHFVRIPPPPNNQVPDPTLKTLALRDASGNCAIAVWGCPPKWTIKSNSTRFAADRYRDDGLLSYFMLRGLKAGDVIVVFGDRQEQSERLEITFVATDPNAGNNVAARQSRHSSKFILDPGGIEQGAIRQSAQQWVDDVDKVIEQMLGNPMGALIAASLATPATIRPWLGADQNAFGGQSGVKFTPRLFAFDTRPGARADEVLLHELCHVAEGNYQGYKNPPGPNPPDDEFDYTPGEFFSVTGANVYASLAGRPLRKDSRAGSVMPGEYANATTGAATFRAYLEFNFVDFAGRKGDLNRTIQRLAAVWNPFRT